MLNEILKTEYDTTNIDIELLCQRNNIVKEDLPWYHAGYTRLEPLKTIILDTSIEEGMLNSVQDIRDKVLSNVKQRLTLDQLGDGELSIKELKEIEGIVSSIESSIKPKQKEEVTTVNILVQNLMDRTVDDC